MLRDLISKAGIAGKLLFYSVLSVSAGTMTGQTVVSENKVITLLNKKPDQALAVLPIAYDDPVFYFDRNNWYKELEIYTTNDEYKKRYMACHDSLQDLLGNVPLEKLHTYGEGHKGLNTGEVSDEIFVKLLMEGKAFVRYKNGFSPASIKTVRKSSKRGYTIFFMDGKNTVYHISYKTKGNF